MTDYVHRYTGLQDYYDTVDFIELTPPYTYFICCNNLYIYILYFKLT